MYRNLDGKRVMAWIEEIDEIREHPNADMLELVKVGGWQVVVKKGEYQAGDRAVYCAIDSWIPHELAPFLSKGQEPREFNGIKGEKVRTIKLRGELSQGLLLPTSVIVQDGVNGNEYPFIEGSDVTELLGIQKWEAPIPAQIAGQVKGNFPDFIPKTDQERVQNLDLSEFPDDATWEVSVKLDGTSVTLYLFEGEIGVCSRNLELKINEENANNSLVKLALEKQNALLKMWNLAIQGELIGEGIQGNKEKLKGQEFYVFDMYDIDAQKYLPPKKVRELCQSLNFNHVPVLDVDASTPASIDQALAMADGPSLNAAVREGIVFKCNENPKLSFKAISNKFLLKEK